jgi:hypothetical protein
LGAATARRLHAAGALVTIADLNAERGAALMNELGERAGFIHCDVTDPAAVDEAVIAARADGSLRIAITCAGVGWAEKTAGKRGPHSVEPFHTVVAVNLLGSFHLLRAAGAAMLNNDPDEAGECGVIVMTASIAAYDGQIGQLAYAASKGGAARGARPRGQPDPRLHDRARPVRHPAAGRAARGGARGARRAGPAPRAAGRPGGVRVAGRARGREPDAQRRGHPARRRAPHATALTRTRSQSSQLRCRLLRA